MKHLFFIHSPITYLVAKEIVRHEKLKSDDCFLVSQSNYLEKVKKYNKTFKNIITLDPNQFTKQSLKDEVKNDLKIIFKLKKIIKENYKFYVAHDLFFFSKYLAFNNLCVGYYYMEEGTASYNRFLLADTFKKKKPIKKGVSFIYPRLANSIIDKKIKLDFLLPLACKIIPENLFHNSNKLLGTYSFSTKAFNFINKKNILLPTEFIRDLDSELDNKFPILIFDNGVNLNLYKLDSLVKVVNGVLEVNDKIYVKFHPVQKDEERTILEEVFNNSNCMVEILTEEVVIEEILYKNLELIGVFSSLLYYNKVFSTHGKSISLLDKINNLESRQLSTTYQDLVSFYKENNITFD